MSVSQTAFTLIVVVGITSGQVLFKLAADSISSGGIVQMLRELAVSPYFLAAILIYGGMTALWISVLQNASLSHAYPLFALTFLLVPIFSALFLSESLNTATMIGSVLIVSGIIVATTNATA
ncbi:MAG TPA: EamA family transporter [Dehalococcoidia bacterium]|nr:EamA family transporter [Dehalococcoidia bacterium]